MQALPNKKRESKWAGVWEFIGLVAIGASAWAMSIMVLSI